MKSAVTDMLEIWNLKLSYGTGFAIYKSSEHAIKLKFELIFYSSSIFKLI